MAFGEIFLRDTAGSAERTRWLYLAHSGSQSQRMIWFILPAHGDSHINIQCCTLVSNGVILSSIIKVLIMSSLFSNMGLWQQLERSDKEGRIVFHWSNSFSKHKKLLSLTIRPDRPPPLQVSISQNTLIKNVQIKNKTS